ncbi:Leucine-rich repeat - like 10, partial [Theobroma cacao]
MLFYSLVCAELSVFENLEELDLSFNGLSDPKSFPELRKLKYLDLSINVFSKHVMRLLARLPSLKYLDLTDNSLRGGLTPQ